MSAPLAVPVLAGRGVTLRPHTVADLDAVVERCVDPDSVRWTTVPTPYTVEDGRGYLRSVIEGSPDLISWAIETDDGYAGTLDLRVRGGGEVPGWGEFGFVTHPRSRGLGVMTEAVRIAVEHAFETLDHELLVWQAHVGNFGSFKPMWRNGFPCPVAVPALLDQRGVARDGWHSVLEVGMPREPLLPWDEVHSHLQQSVELARRPG